MFNDKKQKKWKLDLTERCLKDYFFLEIVLRRVINNIQTQ